MIRPGGDVDFWPGSPLHLLVPRGLDVLEGLIARSIRFIMKGPKFQDHSAELREIDRQRINLRILLQQVVGEFLNILPGSGHVSRGSLR